MSLPISGEIRFSQLQTIMGGGNPIYLSEYYQNNSNGYTSGILGIPNIGSTIKISDFYGKSKPPTLLLYQNIGTFNLTLNTNKNCDILVIAGGGGGGSFIGSGGGAGGLIYITNYTLLAGTYSITVGNGGLGMSGYKDNTRINGGNSSISGPNNFYLLALGGAKGNGQSTAYDFGTNNVTGGCGAGGVRWKLTGSAGIQKTSTTGLSSTNGYGNNGGNGYSSYNWPYSAGGGGGAGSAGLSGTGSGGNGGVGLQINITGTNTYYAGGGGGSSSDGGQGTGGLGGGGNGTNGNGVNGTNGTGGGGGGGNYGIGGNGGSGIVIIKYNN